MKKFLCALLVFALCMSIPMQASASSIPEQCSLWSNASGTYQLEAEDGGLELGFTIDSRYGQLYVVVTDRSRETVHVFDGDITAEGVTLCDLFGVLDIFMELKPDGAIVVTDNDDTEIAEYSTDTDEPAAYYNLDISGEYKRVSDETPVIQFRMPVMRHDIPGWVGDEPEEPNYIGYYETPIKIRGLGDLEFDINMRDYIWDIVEEQAEYFAEDYRSMLDESEDDPYLKELATHYSSTEELFVLTASENYCAIASRGYIYTGGAHGMPYIGVYNIGVNEKRLITLGDLFENEGYLEVIEDKLGEMAGTDEYMDLLYSHDEEMKIKVYEDESNFFLSNDSLVIYYHPYDIGPYAAGFIRFRIPLADLEDIMKAEYFNSDYSRQNGESMVF